MQWCALIHSYTEASNCHKSCDQTFTVNYCAENLNGHIMYCINPIKFDKKASTHIPFYD